MFMNKLKLILLFCLLSQGCSTGSNLPINQPRSSIHNFVPASIEDVTTEQPISVDDLDKKQPETKDEVLEEPKLNNGDGAIRNMSDTSDFRPDPHSYWM